MADKDEQPDDAAREAMEALLEPTIAHVIHVYAAQALASLGLIAMPGMEKPEVDLHHAKFAIGVLEVLEKKTKGNLTSEEEGMLGDLLHQSRMAFLQVSKTHPPEKGGEKKEGK